jgi:AcrR family transcriptional regulator
MVKKAPRRTAQRIIESSLSLFNRFGEPNVSTNLISSELRISPGNLYYHFPAKDELVNALFDQYLAQLNPLLEAAGDVRDVEDAWFFIHSLFERLWEHRFLYRDLNDLLSRNRRLEIEVKDLLARKQRAFVQLIAGLHHQGARWGRP